MFASGDDENSDWLLHCGGLLVGRVHRPGSRRQDTFSWSLTGLHAPLVTMRGDAARIDDAKEHLIAALRAWAPARRRCRSRRWRRCYSRLIRCRTRVVKRHPEGSW